MSPRDSHPALISRQPRPLNPSALWGLAALSAIGLSLYATGLSQQELFNLNGWPQFWRFLTACLHPDLSSEMLRLTWDATLTTLTYAVCGTCLSVLLGLVGGVLGSEVWWSAVFPARVSRGKATSIWLAVRAVLAIPRAIHELIWGLIFVNLWGLDPLTAVLAIAVPFGAITAKVFSELLDETPRQPLLSLLNSGVAPLSAFTYGLLPQAFLNLLSYTFYRFECSIRSAAVLGIIGAGGLGYEIFLSLQSLKYEQLWTLIAALFLLNGCVDFASAWLRNRWGCTSRLDLNLIRQANKRRASGGHPSRESLSKFQSQNSNPRSPSPPLSKWANQIQMAAFSILAFGLILFCFWYVGADFSKLWSPLTWQRLIAMLQACFPPDRQVVSQLWPLSQETLAMSVLAITLAALGGSLLSFPAAHNFFLPGGVLNPNPHDRLGSLWAWSSLLLSRALLLFCRAIPAPIWALIILFLTFPGILPGAIALGLHNLGILGRLQAEVIENLDTRPLEALKGQGAANSLVFLYGVLPLTLPRFTAYGLYRWEVCMRETVIVGLVGAGGLGRLLTEQLSSFDYQGMSVTLGGFLLLTCLVDWMSASSRRALR